VFTLEFISAGGGTQVAAVGGAVSLHEARDLERGVIAGLCRGRTRVVLDLREVTLVGPGLLGVLLRIRRGVTRLDGQLAMVVAGPPGSDLVRATVLTSLIAIAGDRDRALELVGAYTAATADA
jgi:anti-anti-sigma regulatory factor